MDEVICGDVERVGVADTQILPLSPLTCSCMRVLSTSNGLEKRQAPMVASAPVVYLHARARGRRVEELSQVADFCKHLCPSACRQATAPL